MLVIAAIISVLRYHDLTGGGKLLWILVILAVPLIGSIFWFVAGRKGKVNELLGIDRHSPPTAPAASH